MLNTIAEAVLSVSCEMLKVRLLLHASSRRNSAMHAEVASHELRHSTPVRHLMKSAQFEICLTITIEGRPAHLLIFSSDAICRTL